MLKKMKRKGYLLNKEISKKKKEKEEYMYAFRIVDDSEEGGVPFFDIVEHNLISGNYYFHVFCWEIYPLWLSKQIFNLYINKDIFIYILPFLFHFMIEYQVNNRIEEIKELKLKEEPKLNYLHYLSYQLPSYLEAEEIFLQVYCLENWIKLKISFYTIPRSKKHMFLK